LDRRDFLRAGVSAAGLAAFAPLLDACSDDDRDRAAEHSLAQPRLLDRRPSDVPIDTVVILMMENRSFDHYLGWLARDDAYLDAGRRAYGRKFSITGDQQLRYEDAHGVMVPTRHLPNSPGETNPFRGCDHRIPGHGWDTGRVQRDHGFVAAGSGNDTYALGYYESPDIALHSDLARRFTVTDHSFSSLLASTFPNRQYLHAATSEGRKQPPAQLDAGVFTAATIWDRLAAAGVPARYYYVDLPFLALYGSRLFDRISSLDSYYEDADAGRLPSVVMIDPGFEGPERTDNHPHGDIHMAQRFMQSVFAAFARSPQWQRGLFVLTYDEWGGFFDHVRPPVVPDDHASDVDADNFGQTGFRVPTILASPFARRGFVDHTHYDSTSILRFLEWRFLGAPPEGTIETNGAWYLTKRDRAAHNLGASLVTASDPELDFDLNDKIPEPTDACAAVETPSSPTELGPSDVPHSAEFDEIVTRLFPPATERPWLPA
jgi:phospholipase C